MVVELGDLESANKPVFVPRKKRRGNLVNSDEGSKTLAVTAISMAARVAQETSSPSNSINTNVLPAWRTEKEKQDSSADSVKQPTVLKWTDKARTAMTPRDWKIMYHDLKLSTSKPLHPLLNWQELLNTKVVEFLKSKYPAPTPIQRAAVRVACSTSQDMIAIAPTGSGKTLAFLVPIAELHIRKSLILAPTRELVLQTADVAKSLLPKQHSVVALVGGRSFEEQEQELRSISDHSTIVATPGRLLDFLNQKLVTLQDVEYLIFDEADRMIDAGFEEQVKDIMKHLKSSSRRTMMFSATWPPEVQQLASHILQEDRYEVHINSDNSGNTPKIKQGIELVNGEEEKFQRLLDILRTASPVVICFVATKHAADNIAASLRERGIKSQCIHGGMSQASRDSTIAAARRRQLQCLVATDVASRGMDISNITLVINYNLPQSTDTYVHRVGRSGRAGAKGNAISFAEDSDKGIFPELKAILRQSGNKIPTFMQ